ncbi:MAG: hypothetical protein K8I30_01065, partial [Anaerolineae bacterium]|nr:hypothetical protein [Anaerolineae bacterium]
MPFTPKQPYPKARGQTLRSEDWNDLVTEVQRLDTAKVNKAGDIMTGPLTINAALSGAVHLSLLGTGSSYLNLRAASTGQEILVGVDSTGGIVSTMSNHDLQLRAGGNATRLIIKNTGRVGIGTNDPSNMLHVASPLGLRVGDLYLGGSINWSSLSYNAHHNEANSAWVFPNPTRPAITLEMDNSGVSFPRFEVFSTTTANLTGFQSRFRVEGQTGHVIMGQTGGNVGIGVNPPGDRLHVVTSMTVGPFRAREEASGRFTVSGPSAEIVFVRRGLSSWPASPAAGDRFLWYNDGNIARLWTEVNGDLMRITSSGAVGIDATPAVKLHVVGNRIRLQAPGTNRILDMRADGTALDLESTSDLFINNNAQRVFIRNLQGTSSRIYKDDIAPLDGEDALSLLDALEPVTFYFK